MAVTISRTAMIDDDGSGTTGTIINNAWKQEFYGQIDGALATVDAAAVPSYGSFVPTFYATGGGLSGQVYGLQAGSYAHIGKLWIGGGRLAMTAKGTWVGNLGIALNLPGAPAANHYSVMPCGGWESFAAGRTNCYIEIRPGQSTNAGILGTISTSGTIGLITPADILDSFSIWWSFAFVTA